MLRLQKSLADQADQADASLKEVQSKPAEQVLGMSHPLDGSYQGQAVRTGRPVYVAQVQPGDPFPANLAVEHAVESFCIVPLTTPRRTLGTLDFGSLRPHAYTPEDVEFMSRVASLVAVAIENAINLETVREQRPDQPTAHVGTGLDGGADCCERVGRRPVRAPRCRAPVGLRSDEGRGGMSGVTHSPLA